MLKMMRVIKDWISISFVLMKLLSIILGILAVIVGLCFVVSLLLPSLIGKIILGCIVTCLMFGFLIIKE